jgi:hypothetical protein
MILLGRYGYNSEVYTGWDYMKWAGLIRSGNLVRAGREEMPLHGHRNTVW